LSDGSSGTYGAIRLQASGKSVVVIEANDVLGGHANTYTDPASNRTIEYGV
jgi:phytoene dehydrogenase-like protein